MNKDEYNAKPKKKYTLTNRNIHQSNYCSITSYCSLQWIVTQIWWLYWLHCNTRQIKVKNCWHLQTFWQYPCCFGRRLFVHLWTGLLQKLWVDFREIWKSCTTAEFTKFWKWSGRYSGFILGTVSLITPSVVDRIQNFQWHCSFRIRFFSNRK